MPDDDLDPAPPDDTAEDDAEDLADDARRDEESFAAEISVQAVDISSALEALQVETTNLEAAQIATSEAVYPVDVAVESPEPSSRLEQQENQLEAVMKQVAAAPEADKQWTTTQWLACAFGVSAVGVAGALLLEYLSRLAHGQSTDDLPPIPDTTSPDMEALVQQWQSQPDAQFWNSLAGYVETQEPPVGLANQIVFMNYVIQLCPATRLFLWNSNADKASMADQFVAAYNSAGDSAPAMYRAVPTTEYNGAPLPRVAAADVLRLSLSWISSST
jgi:hypothetical protein